MEFYYKVCYSNFILGYYDISEEKVSLVKYDNFTAEYVLNGESIDIMSEKIAEFLTSLGVERANVLGIRLSMEEALLRWYDHFSKKDEETRIGFFMGKNFLRPYVSIELRGEAYDPMDAADPDSDVGDWVGTVMGNIGLSPRYSYQRDRGQQHDKRHCQAQAIGPLSSVCLLNFHPLFLFFS